MDREIIFRGKRVDNGEWVEGYYVKINTDRSIDVFYDEIFTGKMSSDNNGRVDFKRNIVTKETVRQYTGLKDSTGKRIFEGDILEFWQPEFDLTDKSWGIVRYFADEDYPAFDIETLNVDSNGLSYIMANCECEIIGNIHDNDLKSNA